MKVLSLLLLLVSFYSSLSFAGLKGPFTVVCTGTCNALTKAALQALEDDVNKDLPDADQSTYLKGMANASAMSVKGSGSDYANDVDLFLVRVSGGVGADLGDSSFGDLTSGDIKGNQVRGFGISPSILVGLSLGIFNLPEWEYFNPNKLKVFVNFFSLDIGKFVDDLDVKATNFGVRGRYKLIDPIAWVPGKLLHWTGIDVHAGFDIVKLKVVYKKTQTETFNPGAGVTATISGDITVGAEISTVSIPIEISTGVQLGYILSLYGGFGLDLTFGSATSIIDASAPITTSVGDSGTGSLNLGESGDPTAVAPRVFFGTQFNLSVVKVGVQFDKSLADSAYGINIGLGVTW